MCSIIERPCTTDKVTTKAGVACGREWVERLAGLAVDKHLEVRRTADQALATVHSLVDGSVLREHLKAVDLASDIRTTLLQILQVRPQG